MGADLPADERNRAMIDITVIELSDRRFGVEIVEGDQARSAHTVTVPDELLDDLGITPEESERLVRESFEFLLERERPTQILREFSLEEIGRFFPEYRTEIADRLAA
jgi:hypothetical protein